MFIYANNLVYLTNSRIVGCIMAQVRAVNPILIPPDNWLWILSTTPPKVAQSGHLPMFASRGGRIRHSVVRQQPLDFTSSATKRQCSSLRLLRNVKCWPAGNMSRNATHWRMPMCDHWATLMSHYYTHHQLYTPPIRS